MSEEHASSWAEGLPVHASCQFCGRFVNKEHAQLMPYIMAIFVGKNETPKVLVVSDAIWCGICRVQPDPQEIPEIY